MNGRGPTPICARLATMSTAMKPSEAPVGRIFEDGLSTEELRAVLDVEGADVSAGTADEIKGYLYRRIEAIAEHKRRP